MRARLPHGTALVLGTSGSTGASKAVALSDAGLAHQAQALQRRLTIDASDRLLVPIPLTHAYGSSVLELWLRSGCTLVTAADVAPAVLATLLTTHAPTSLDCVPSMAALLLSKAKLDDRLLYALRRLRMCNVGGDVLPSRLATNFLSATGKPLLDGYGLTEAGPNVAVNAPADWRIGTVGRPLDGTEIRTAANGELLTRSPGQMLGYVGDPAATQEAVDPDGWLRTSDLGIVDNGYLRILGRLKDVIVVHGQTFAPSVIEDSLRSCRGVAEAGVIPRSSGAARGDHVVAFVTASPGHDEAALPMLVREVSRRDLPPSVRPVEVRVLQVMPRLASGKVDRQALRQLAAS